MLGPKLDLMNFAKGSLNRFAFECRFWQTSIKPFWANNNRHQNSILAQIDEDIVVKLNSQPAIFLREGM